MEFMQKRMGALKSRIENTIKKITDGVSYERYTDIENKFNKK